MTNILTIPEQFHPAHRSCLFDILRQDYRTLRERGFWAMVREEYLLTDCTGTATKIIKEQLNNRDADTASNWNNFDLESNIVNDVCKIIQDVMDWPNARYLPNDSLDLILLYSWDSDDFVLICDKLYDKYTVDIQAHILKFGIRVQDMTLADFVIILCDKIRAEKQGSS